MRSGNRWGWKTTGRSPTEPSSCTRRAAARPRTAPAPRCRQRAWGNRERGRQQWGHLQLLGGAHQTPSGARQGGSPRDALPTEGQGACSVLLLGKRSRPHSQPQPHAPHTPNSPQKQRGRCEGAPGSTPRALPAELPAPGPVRCLVWGGVGEVWGDVGGFGGPPPARTHS